VSEPDILFKSDRPLEAVLRLWDEGDITRAEFVSELASRPEVPLKDPELAAEVAKLRRAIAEGRVFVLSSRC
jgi:hypothetical protein